MADLRALVWIANNETDWGKIKAAWREGRYEIGDNILENLDVPPRGTRKYEYEGLFGRLWDQFMREERGKEDD